MLEDTRALIDAHETVSSPQSRIVVTHCLSQRLRKTFIEDQATPTYKNAPDDILKSKPRPAIRKDTQDHYEKQHFHHTPRKSDADLMREEAIFVEAVKKSRNYRYHV